MWPLLLVAPVLGVHPADCGYEAFCAKYNGSDWHCKTDPADCDESDSIMLHMRTVGNFSFPSRPQPCLTDAECSPLLGEECIARQCRNLTGTGDRRQGSIAAAAACAALGPEYYADIDETVPSVDCKGPVTAAGDEYEQGDWSVESGMSYPDTVAHICSMCIAFGARIWDSRVVLTRRTPGGTPIGKFCEVVPAGAQVAYNHFDCTEYYGNNLFVAREGLLEAEPLDDGSAYRAPLALDSHGAKVRRRAAPSQPVPRPVFRRPVRHRAADQ